MTSSAPAADVSVCVYCASGPVDQQYLDLAAEVGRKIAKRGWTLVSGGGRVSMMGEVARAARADGGRTVGVIPHALVDKEMADDDADELLVVDNMRERKGLMDAHSTAFIALPGGIGTCEELFEIWTSRYIGMHDKPIVLLDPYGHYEGLLAWLQGLVDSGFAKQYSMDVLTVTTDVDAALDACAP
ncbi:TIGR00730 family Rossman fold protein [Saccharopolyspora oryzae]|uniref:Cytokinin riboside 5'-monophosphate phosphoribohydrolase n=1 Tax=Saccharopolyspora oryzae TaxID=2997343 RepID=A0ABT4UX42_9PSEU|nr:TIGR00730 family Rossman fold protein [Saccharopolyspora oryzae]MDA3626255.1 TIGR00730 family Rossman fold protein [Saccharopolyspora oryzae]